MILRGQTGEYSAHFFHDYALNRKGTGTVRATIATVHPGRCARVRPCEDREQVVGLARCDPREPFVKADGRRVALTRAIKQLRLTYRERAHLWDSYLKRIGLRPKDAPIIKSRRRSRRERWDAEVA